MIVMNMKHKTERITQLLILSDPYNPPLATATRFYVESYWICVRFNLPARGVMVIRCLTLAIGLLAGFAPLSAAATQVADYSIAALEYAPAPLDRVGKLQAGLLCLPKGKLRWRDVARPEAEAAARTLSAALGERLSVAARADRLFGDPDPVTRFRVRVVVETLNLRLCIAGLGIGEKTPSGEGSMTVRWETYDRMSRARIADDVFVVPLLIKGRDVRGASGILSDALVESAARYAATR